MACSCCVSWLDWVFEDKRIGITLVMGWLAAMIFAFAEEGFFKTDFMTFGPSEHTLFMSMKVDTWKKWWLIGTFVAFNTAINDFMSDSIVPWILNTIMDHKCHYLPYPKWVCLMITENWSVYQNMMSVISVSVATTQVDFVLIRLGVDLIVNSYTNLKFMRHKEYSLAKYRELEIKSGIDPHTRHMDDLDPAVRKQTEDLEMVDARRS